MPFEVVIVVVDPDAQTYRRTPQGSGAGAAMAKSDRDPAVPASEREARLAARMAKEYLRSGAVEDAMGYLQHALADPDLAVLREWATFKTLFASKALNTAPSTSVPGK